MSSAEELFMFRIWKRVDPMMTKRKIPSSQGPTCDDYYFFCIVEKVQGREGFCPKLRFGIFGFSASFIGRWP
jgi:hypothetical protein